MAPPAHPAIVIIQRLGRIFTLASWGAQMRAGIALAQRYAAEALSGPRERPASGAAISSPGNCSAAGNPRGANPAAGEIR